MRALSIRQPFAELILQGLKTVEYRSRATRIIGERFYIYAAKRWGAAGDRRSAGGTIWSRDLAAPAPGETLPPWMVELAEALRLWKPGDLPTGVIVGMARIARCVRDNGHYRWHLADVTRLPHSRKPTRMPQPVWFSPF